MLGERSDFSDLTVIEIQNNINRDTLADLGFATSCSLLADLPAYEGYDKEQCGKRRNCFFIA